MENEMKKWQVEIDQRQEYRMEEAAEEQEERKTGKDRSGTSIGWRTQKENTK